MDDNADGCGGNWIAGVLLGCAAAILGIAVWPFFCAVVKLVLRHV